MPRSDRRGAAPPAGFARILLVHPGALGDLVQALPAIGAVRARYPEARIALATGDDLAPLAAALGLVDEVIAVDTRAAYRGTATGRARALGRAARAARTWRPDAAATFKAGLPWAALARTSGAPVRVGLARGAIGRALLTSPRDPPADEHHEDRYAEVARALGAAPDRAAPDCVARPRWPEALSHAVSAALDAARDHVAGGGRLVALAPGGARNVKQDTARKRWAVERWAALAAAVVEAWPDVHLVLLGGPEDRVEADLVRAAVPAWRTTDLVGHTTVAEARAVLTHAAACVVHDSGLLHLAATTPAGVVAVFGPTDPRILCPRREGVVALWSPARARPCQDGRTGAVRPCATPCCMDRVTVGDALAAVGVALAAGDPPGDEDLPNAAHGLSRAGASLERP